MTKYVYFVADHSTTMCERPEGKSPEGNEMKNKAKKKAAHHENKEINIFITLSYIIFSYLLCWVPFHFVFDISAISPELVPEPIYTFTFWLTYFNSTLNPFLYAYSNKEFKQAFKKVVKCRWVRKCK